MREIIIGILASMFFAVTFILNRSMELSGGSWIWSSSLRFIFMLPFFILIVLIRKNMKIIFHEIKNHPFQWMIWSFFGFVLFYAPITYAAAYGPGWLVAGSWQLTIVAGTLLAPLFVQVTVTEHGLIKHRQKIPLASLSISLIILLGVLLIQLQHAGTLTFQDLLVGILPVTVAAFAYPLGNRKMMEVCGGRLDTFQRILGMTLCSLPFWLALAIYGVIRIGPPSNTQITQSLIVAICSGVIATTLFFIATDRVRHHQEKLASVEATQSTQIIFVLIGEILILSSPMPNGLATFGLVLVMLGMLFHSFYSKRLSTIQTKQKLLA
ncbi:multidrug resistance efflux transporter family protein [Halalkalibacter suaedae]|uniref:Multidrug resistance efflux transporter family protein n=1 Tax=Halalkalibacter suaedae TaxID=2822140 RepID=A0A940WYN5_9BACI|nr:multidrug resistance efflux transporter family protein [Bacillus suaedae]